MPYAIMIADNIKLSNPISLIISLCISVILTYIINVEDISDNPPPIYTEYLNVFKELYSLSLVILRYILLYLIITIKKIQKVKNAGQNLFKSIISSPIPIFYLA
jgi:hypothetical protein